MCAKRESCLKVYSNFFFQFAIVPSQSFLKQNNLRKCRKIARKISIHLHFTTRSPVSGNTQHADWPIVGIVPYRKALVFFHPKTENHLSLQITPSDPNQSQCVSLTSTIMPSHSHIECLNLALTTCTRVFENIEPHVVGLSLCEFYSFDCVCVCVCM